MTKICSNCGETVGWGSICPVCGTLIEKEKDGGPTDSYNARKYISNDSASECQGLYDKLERATVIIRAIDIRKSNEDNQLTGSQGTAWFVNYKGYDKYLITNCHVVAEGDYYLAQFSPKVDPRQENYSAHVLFVDPANDLALLQLNADLGKMNILKNRCSLPLADISTVKEGDDVCTLGNPEGMTWILTKGSISGVRFGDYGFSAQTGCNRLLADITSTHGNSGGAVCNKRGEVVGLITQGSDKFPRQSACVSCFAVEQMLSVYFANKE